MYVLGLTIVSSPYSAYAIESKEELLRAINEFLDESVVLPPGDWGNEKLLR